MSAPEAPRRMQLTGLHHVTLICADLGRTSGFYRDVLGLTLVQEGMSEDDPGTRHFWFGDAAGTPGTLVTFLEYPDLPEGTVGRGSTHHLAFGVASVAELDAWRAWMTRSDVPVTDVFDRSGLRSIYVRDPDGHIIEIAAAAGS